MGLLFTTEFVDVRYHRSQLKTHIVFCIHDVHSYLIGILRSIWVNYGNLSVDEIFMKYIFVLNNLKKFCVLMNGALGKPSRSPKGSAEHRLGTAALTNCTFSGVFTVLGAPCPSPLRVLPVSSVSTIR